jgi:hypothetical protein
MIELALVYKGVVAPSALERTTRLNSLGMSGSLTNEVIEFITDNVEDTFGSKIDVHNLWLNAYTIQDIVVQLDYILIDLLVDSIFE